jgi:hypothetical protein
LIGDTVIESGGALVTVSVVVPETLEVKSFAVISFAPVMVPAVTRPVLLMVAAAVPDVVQDVVANVVKFCVIAFVGVPPENIAVAVNWCVVPIAMYGLAGVTVIACGEATESVAVPEMLFDVSVAAMVTVPAVPLASEVARPFEPAVLLIVTMVTSDEFQVTAEVQFRVVPSENVAVAVSCWVVPIAMVGLVGVTVIDVMVPPRIQLMKPITVTDSTARTKMRDLIVLIMVVSLDKLHYS